ncbi:hypothetical protein Cgig2_013697 [Carnegiea gigantea]|uniref:Uncharacterized protein n=1 Tax=Carnegiea gigantea TaxID=171969 RepID=A0A9Q1QGG7_9CARY|nr:hypothetical protein Cgig2_013697 [Carnegiea gigantea]
MRSVRWKSWPQLVLTTEQGPHTTVPAMMFGRKEASRFTSPHNDPLVVEIKIVSAIVQRILIDTCSDDCLKKLTHPRRDIVPLVHPILGFGRQEVNPTGMIRLPIRFGDKLRSKNLEVDFLVVDVPTAYNVILGSPTLHKLPHPLHPHPRQEEVLGQLALVYIVEVGLKAAILLKFLSWRHQDFT